MEHSEKELTGAEIEKEIIEHIQKNIHKYVPHKQRMMVKHRYFKALAKQKIIKEVHSWSEEKKREFYRNMKIVEGGVKKHE